MDPVAFDGVLVIDKPAGPTSHDIVACVRRTLSLKKVGHLVRSIHCKDATWAAEDVRGTEWGAEVPLGEGDVGMEDYLRTLDAIGFDGPLTIEREIPQEPERQKAEIGAALQLLEDLKSRLQPAD